MGVYIDEPHVSWKNGGEGAASRWWLGKSLISFAKDLSALGVPLLIFKGEPAHIFKSLKAHCAFHYIHADARIEPFFQARDTQLAKVLEPIISLKFYPAGSFLSNSTLLTKTGAPYKVFMPFWKAVLAELHRIGPQPPLPTPKKQEWPYFPEIAGRLSPEVFFPASPHWALGWENLWNVSEASALNQWNIFVSHHLNEYQIARDFPIKEGTSRLSPYIHWGQISVRSLAHELWAHPQGEPFLRELAWREFNRVLLTHFPTLVGQPFIKNFLHFPWQEDETALKAWQRGETGYPIVDAGMRQLWQTGWMHNRVRMIVASFLTKDLLTSWDRGHTWFWETLVDADLANNVCNWQWVAGCGINAAPFFRIFNPVVQSKKFDPKGDYIRQYIPELRHVPLEFIHEPWRVPLASSQYPLPIIDHAYARERALRAFEDIRNF